MLSRISLATVGLVVGGVLSIVGLIAYATNNPTLNLAGFFYGFPILIGGIAFKATELKPSPYVKPTTPEVKALREKEATDTQKQVIKDIRRYRYGQDFHLDLAMARLDLGTRKEVLPILTGFYEEERHGHYSLVLEFDSTFVSFEKWQYSHSKIESFFGPGITAEIEDLGAERARLALISSPESRVSEAESPA